MTRIEREEHRAIEEDDWATIREIIKIGGSLPLRLQRIYDSHMLERATRMFGALSTLRSKHRVIST